MEMGLLIEDAIEKCMYAFKTQDEALAKEIILGDRNINDIEKTIEARCLSYIKTTTGSEGFANCYHGS